MLAFPETNRIHASNPLASELLRAAERLPLYDNREFYSTDLQTFVRDSIRSSNPEVVLEATRGALDAGARGVVYGRNVWQADDPVMMCGLLREVIHARTAVPV